MGDLRPGTVTINTISPHLNSIIIPVITTLVNRVILPVDADDGVLLFHERGAQATRWKRYTISAGTIITCHGDDDAI